MSVNECYKTILNLDLRDRKLKGINSVTELSVKGPGYALIQGLDRNLGLLGNVSHDRVDHLALVVSLLAFDDILR